jgi:hypothetical protein
MLGKNGIFRGKSFEKSFFQEIPRKKMYEKSAPEQLFLVTDPILRQSRRALKGRLNKK